MSRHAANTQEAAGSRWQTHETEEPERLMHEVGIMQSVLEIAERQAKNSSAVAILEIRIRVGRLTGIVLESLDHAFTVLKEGTMAERGTLVVDDVPGRCFCPECTAEFEADGLFARCPTCDRPSLDIRRGRELEVVSLEVE